MKQHLLRQFFFRALLCTTLASFMPEISGQETPPQAELSEAYQQVRIGIFINGRSDSLQTWFGHAGVVISGSKQHMQAVALDNRKYFSRLSGYSGEALAFDYGNFDSSSNFLYRFLIGQLKYYKMVAPYEQFVARNNTYDKRALSVYWLDLTLEQKRKFAQILFYETSPEQNMYKYHFYFDNCLTRIRDQLDQIFEGRLSSQITGNSELTIRQILRREIADKFWGLLLLEYLQGAVIDQKYSRWDSVFFPSHMPGLLKSLKLPGTQRPLLTAEETVFPYTREELAPRQINTLFLASYVFIVLLLSFFLWRRHYIFSFTPRSLRKDRLAKKRPVNPTLKIVARSSYWLLFCSVAVIISIFSGVLWLLNILQSFDVAMQNAFILLGTPFLAIQILAVPFLFFRATRTNASRFVLWLWRIHLYIALCLPLFAWLYAFIRGQLMQDLLLPWLSILPILCVLACLPHDLYLYYRYNNKD